MVRKSKKTTWVDAVGIHCEPSDVGWSPVPEEIIRAVLESMVRAKQNADDVDYLLFAMATTDHREIVFEE